MEYPIYYLDRHPPCAAVPHVEAKMDLLTAVIFCLVDDMLRRHDISKAAIMQMRYKERCPLENIIACDLVLNRDKAYTLSDLIWNSHIRVLALSLATASNSNTPLCSGTTEVDFSLSGTLSPGEVKSAN